MLSWGHVDLYDQGRLTALLDGQPTTQYGDPEDYASSNDDTEEEVARDTPADLSLRFQRLISCFGFKLPVRYYGALAGNDYSKVPTCGVTTTISVLKMVAHSSWTTDVDRIIAVRETMIGSSTSSKKRSVRHITTWRGPRQSALRYLLAKALFMFDHQLVFDVATSILMPARCVLAMRPTPDSSRPRLIIIIVLLVARACREAVAHFKI